MLLDFSIKIIDHNGKFLRTMSVSACDLEMALCMASNFLGEDEFVGGF